MSARSISMPHLVPIAAGDDVARGPGIFADFLERNYKGYRVVENLYFHARRPYHEYRTSADLLSALDGLYKKASTLRTGPIFFGGEHSATFHIVSFLLRKLDSVCLIIFDAHSDCQGDEGAIHNWNFLRQLKATFGTRITLVHLGFRDLDQVALERICDELISVNVIASRGVAFAEQRIKAICGERHTHISIDVDVFDPLLFHSVKSPISGGLLPREVISLLRALVGCNVLSGDIVEFAPGQPLLMEMLLLADLFYELERICANSGHVYCSDGNPFPA